MIAEIGGDFLQWLRGFYFVAKTGSVSLAAREMGRNQPAISHQIKSLENELKIMLFTRSSRKMELTPEGKKILENAICIFEIIKEMKSGINDGDIDFEEKIVIAATHGIMLYFLPRFIVNFHTHRPKVKFELEVGPSKTILGKIESAEADFGIANLYSIPDKIEYQNLFETRLMLITSKDIHCLRQDDLTLDQISEVPFISFPTASTTARILEETFAAKGLKLNTIQVTDNFELLKKYVELGLGVAVTGEFTLREEDSEKFNILSLEQYFSKQEYGIITHKKKYLSPAVRSFIKALKSPIGIETSAKSKKHLQNDFPGKW